MCIADIVASVSRVVLPISVRDQIRPRWQQFIDRRRFMKEIASLGPENRWSKVQESEDEFWDLQFSGRGEWSAALKVREDPNRPLQGYLTALIDAPPDANVKVLDIGAGPLTSLGYKWPGRTIELTPLDPKAAEYDRILARYAITPPVRTITGEAENLSRFVAPSSFDLVHARNSIDHTWDALQAIRSMVEAVKPGCCVYLNHSIREGRTQRYRTNHQWDLFPHRGRFYVERPGMRAVDVGGMIGPGAAVIVCPSPDGEAWFAVKILRKG